MPKKSVSTPPMHAKSTPASASGSAPLSAADIKDLQPEASHKRRQTPQPPHESAPDEHESGEHAKPELVREVFGLTDVGLVRDGNEDALLLLEDERLYVVADGMGGHSAGEVASAFTVEALRAFYENPEYTQRVRRYWRRMKREGETGQDPSPHSLRLRKAVESANITVYKTAQEHEQLRDMGTTVVATGFVGNKVFVANVGDSRVYRLRGKKLRQLTEDHSLLNEYIRMNLLRPEEIENFPYRNVIVRALGLQESVVADITIETARVGDQFLLCSDGLTDLVKDDEIRDILYDAPTAEVACYRLVEAAKLRGGHDNITTVIIRLHETGWQPPRAPIPPPPPPPDLPPPLPFGAGAGKQSHGDSTRNS